MQHYNIGTTWAGFAHRIIIMVFFSFAVFNCTCGHLYVAYANSSRRQMKQEKKSMWLSFSGKWNSKIVVVAVNWNQKWIARHFTHFERYSVLMKRWFKSQAHAHSHKSKGKTEDKKDCSSRNAHLSRITAFTIDELIPFVIFPLRARASPSLCVSNEFIKSHTM